MGSSHEVDRRLPMADGRQVHVESHRELETAVARWKQTYVGGDRQDVVDRVRVTARYNRVSGNGPAQQNRPAPLHRVRHASRTSSSG